MLTFLWNHVFFKQLNMSEHLKLKNKTNGKIKVASGYFLEVP